MATVLICSGCGHTVRLGPGAAAPSRFRCPSCRAFAPPTVAVDPSLAPDTATGSRRPAGVTAAAARAARTLPVTCPQCLASRWMPPAVAGKRVTCKRCGCKFTAQPTTYKPPPLASGGTASPSPGTPTPGAAMAWSPIVGPQASSPPPFVVVSDNSPPSSPPPSRTGLRSAGITGMIVGLFLGLVVGYVVGSATGPDAGPAADVAGNTVIDMTGADRGDMLIILESKDAADGWPARGRAVGHGFTQTMLNGQPAYLAVRLPVRGKILRRGWSSCQVRIDDGLGRGVVGWTPHFPSEMVERAAN